MTCCRCFFYVHGGLFHLQVSNSAVYLFHHQIALSIQRENVGARLLGGELEGFATVAHHAFFSAARANNGFLQAAVSQLRSTPKLPRARKPLIEPVAQASGKAGSRSRHPTWLWSNISVTPAVPPKFPSIWKGGWLSQRLSSVPFSGGCHKARKRDCRRAGVPTD